MIQWYRQDKGTGAIEKVSEAAVKEKAKLGYRNWREVMDATTKERPLENNFAYYWKEEER